MESGNQRIASPTLSMKKSQKRLFSYFLLLLMALACTKDVGLITEVEFQLTEQYSPEGFVNQGIPTTFTITPEAEVEGYEYEISYEVLRGAGYYEDSEGNLLEAGRGLVISPLTTAMRYIGIEPGEHQVRITASDNFGISEEIELLYDISNVPAVWEASSTVAEIELGKSTEIQLRFEIINTALDLNYESRYGFTSGSGTLAPLEDGGFAPGTAYEPILPGTYILDFTPAELGAQQIVFTLGDGNGQELTEEISFDVVQNIEVITIFLGDADTLELQVGDEVDPEITFDPPNATDQGFTLVSSDPEVLFIDQNNVCIGLGVGTAVVTVTSTSNPDATDTVTVTVLEADRVPVTSIVVSQQNENETGAERQLTATVLPIEATDTSVLWTSSDPTVASIDENGLLTGLTGGSVTVTATSVSDPDISGELIVEISGALQSGTDILTFGLPSQNDANIDADNHQITVNLTDGSDLNVAPEVLTVSPGAVFSPEIETVRDFSTAVEYTVTAENGDVQNWTINVTVSPLEGSSENEITSFTLPGQLGTSVIDADNATVGLTLPFDADLGISPSEVLVSTGAVLSPGIEEVQDFTEPVVYTVTAENGVERTWTVTVTVLPEEGSVANDIVTFALLGQTGSSIDTENSIVTVTVPNGTDLNVAPQALTVSPGASVSPAIEVVRDFNAQVVYTVTAENGTTREWTVNVTVSAPTGSDANDITAFALPNQSGANIDNDNNTIAVSVPDGTELNVAPVTLSLSPNATVTPAIDIVQDFSAPVEYTVTAENGDEQVWTVNTTVLAPERSGANAIATFSLPGQESSSIDPENSIVTVTVPNGTELNVAPQTLTVSPGASVSPAIEVVRDFNAQVVYTVTAENGTTREWTVNVTVSAPTGSAQNDITTFALPNQSGANIDNDNNTITVSVPDGTELNVAPVTLSLSPNATVTPAIDIVQDFSAPVEYTVTAENGDEQVWTVTTTVLAPEGSGANAIATFSLPGQESSSIDPENSIVTVTVPNGTDLNVAPQALTVSPGASVSPAIEVVQDFNAQVVYTVTAENGTTREWTVNVTVCRTDRKRCERYHGL